MLRLLPALRQISIRPLSAAATGTSSSVSKEALKTLRQRTGYSYVNCRKALVKFGETNVDEAERWLRQLAAKEGWAKAEKLGSRQTAQGYIAVYATGDLAAVVELKCETDFVARSDPFKQLVEEIALAAENAGRKLPKPAEEQLKAFPINAESLMTEKGRSAKEAIAMTVGQLKENITLNRVEVILPPAGSEVYGHSHPKEGTEKVEMGRFVSILAIRRDSSSSSFPTTKLAHQVCQHIIGMSPEKLGTPKAHEENKTEDDVQKSQVEESLEDELNAFTKVESTRIDEDETELLRQPFMLNPSQTVNDYVISHGAKINDFVRLELASNRS